jgi:hypothetical protein
MMGIYQGLCNGENNIESMWALFGLSTKLAQSVIMLPLYLLRHSLDILRLVYVRGSFSRFRFAQLNSLKIKTVRGGSFHQPRSKTAVRCFSSC